MDGTKQASEACIPQPSVAVVAIHGVADQAAGDTVCAVSTLLATAGAAASCYSAGVCETVVLPVYPLGSMKQDADTGSVAHSLKKAIGQARESDFLRPQWHIPDTQGSPNITPSPQQKLDLGASFSDYLLYKACRNGAQDETYETRRIRMERGTGNDAPPLRVDLYEMYWADLSRLSGKVPQIITEAFTLLFRFSQLGRETIARAAHVRHTDAWCQALLRRQRLMDWAMSFALANICLQVLLTVLTIGVLGFLSAYDQPVSVGLAAGFAVTSILWCWYRYSLSWPALLPVAAVIGLAGYGAALLPPHVLIGVSWVGLLVLLCDAGFRVAEDRYPLARTVGWLFLAFTCVTLLWHVAAMMQRDHQAIGFGYWLFASLRTLEYLLCMSIFWWVTVPPFVMLPWFVTGIRMIRRDTAMFRIVATGWLGVLVSLSSYIVIWMGLWGLLNIAAVAGAGELPYTAAMLKEPGVVRADGFLKIHYQQGTQTFVAVLVLPAALLLYMLLTVLPSVFAELGKPIGTAPALGRWLSGGYRGLNRVVMVLTLAGVIVAMLAGAAMAAYRVIKVDFIGAIGLGEAKDFIQAFSAQALTAIFAGTVGAAAAFSLLSSWLKRFVPGLRVPLDVALDVDNHFREFPRRAIPRARIFSRYMALLEHLAAQGYDRIVIVAHSQGTVITAELLRYLKQRALCQRSKEDDRVKLLWQRIEGKVELVTAGCPLRQLYAARFPDLYGWLNRRLDQPVPLAAELGVNRWINTYTTGDYVGRWLWFRATDNDVYRDAPRAGEVVLPAGGNLEFSLGKGAHTHYFDAESKVMGRLIDALIGRTMDDAIDECIKRRGPPPYTSAR